MEYSKCWLGYNPIKDYGDEEIVSGVFVCSGSNSTLSEIVNNAVNEIIKAIKDMLGRNLICNTIVDGRELRNIKAGIVLELAGPGALTGITVPDIFTEEGYHLKQEGSIIYVVAKGEKGLLYGAFDIIRRIASGMTIRGIEVFENPSNRYRMLNHWDNTDGSIERGYSGQSFFFRNDEILINKRTKDYARMIASIGINGVVINNVNVRGMAASGLITDRYLNTLKEMAEIFEGYGIKLYLSANFAAPIEIGGIASADPLNESVAKWWKSCVENIYKIIPSFGGFLVKADSEGRPGPFTYGRTHAEGANMLARALKPYGGLVIWRCFVYNCQQDWRDYKTDRARAAYDNFIGLDGAFDDNVILQIKNGPMDFQVREPVVPLFGGLKNTNMMLEVQIAQEYTGQQKHVCYLIPMWKETLEFNTYAKEEGALVKDIVSGRTYNQSSCGIAAVANTGDDYNWTGHDLAAANLYGYGRLCWNTELTAENIASEWIKQTFPMNDMVYKVVLDILMGSWLTYEKYTSPLGIGWMVNPNHHYGPNVDGYEYDRWGTYHRADRNGLGVDRTMKGTGFSGQYNEPNASMYNSKETCPEELLLFFHYIIYDYKLKSGKTLIQHIYDTHFEGVEEVRRMVEDWCSLEGLIPEDLYNRVLERLLIQYDSSKEWRDRINTYFYRKSGVDDEKNRKIYY